MMKDNRRPGTISGKEIEACRGGNLRRWFRKNLFNLVLIAAALLLFFSPDAKAWVLQRLMSTGLFDAHIEKMTDTAQNTGDTISREMRTGQTLSPLADFTFIDESGKVLKISDFKGKVVFINFWATWCPPCIAELPSIQQLHDEFNDHPEVVFVLLNEDDVRHFTAGKVSAFMKKHHYSVPVYRLHSNVDIHFYAGSLPTTIVLDKQGRVRYRKEGFADYGSERFSRDIKALLREH